MQYRRFGKTEIDIPVFSCGGMRYQQSWKDSDAVSDESQRNLEACIRRAVDLGINHIETARGYGTSEYQLGKILPQIPRDEIIVQTKVAPFADVAQFKATFEKSMSLLQLDHVDIFSFHGINDGECLANTLKCLDTALKWKHEGRIRHIGFSTHGHVSTIVEAIETGVFEHVNLHWYYIFQENWPAIEEARKRDMGVFIISPNDKGGMLYNPSQKLVELCAPLHPMVFNGLYCLSRPEVHTLSCGVARPEDFDVHLETVRLLPEAGELLPPIIARLEAEYRRVLGDAWVDTWNVGLPQWHETPGEINVPVILHLRNLALAYELVEYGKMRYGLLGNGGNWFPGQKAGKLREVDLSGALAASPNATVIPAALAQAHRLLGGIERARLVQDES
ncbi:MAG: aldo/keto reductase [Candidatus Hydrogenedentes bacterium]|nr:aldo/keto reductase [Candidatus Hydrogenedentota bacterium]